MGNVGPARADAWGRLPAAAWGIAAAVSALLVAVAPRYGWHRDELYFLEAGRHLAWGYVDQPPFTPFVARVADEIAPGNLVVLRLLPALVAGGMVLLAAAFARELGGTRRTQIVAAGALAAGGFVLGVGHLLATATFDLAAWLALLCLAARLLRSGDPRLWVAFGALAGVALPLSVSGVSAEVNESVAETVGWPELVDQVAAVVDDLPPGEREGVVLLTGSYGEAGAIDRFGPVRGLPHAYSAHNSYADFRRPHDDGATVVAVRYARADLSAEFERCDPVATVDNEHHIDNEVRGTAILVCRGLRGTWDQVWPRLRHLS